MQARQSVVLIAALLAMSSSALLIRYAEAPAVSVVLWRVVLATPVLLTVALARREPWSVASLGAGTLLAVHWVLWVLAVQHTSIAAASILVCTGALWSAILSRPLLKEHVSGQQWLGVGIAFAGIVVLVSSTEPAGRHTLTGDGYALASAVAWVGYAFIGRRARQTAGFWAYTSGLYLVCGVLVLITAFASKAPLSGFDTQTWIAFGALALLPTLIGHGGTNYVLKYLAPAKLSLWALSEPVVATFLAWPLFAEVPGPQEAAGAALTLLGVAVGVWTRSPSARASNG